jgi:hypothetical protein
VSNAAKQDIPGVGDAGKAHIYNSGTDAWNLLALVQAVNGGKETLVTATTGASYTINLANGNWFDLTLSANCTFAFSGFTSGFGCSAFVILTQGASAFTSTWPAAVKWPSGSIPLLTTTSGNFSVLTFSSKDGGTTIIGGFAGTDYA